MNAHSRLLAFLIISSSLGTAWASPRSLYLLDRGWRFHLGHAADPAKDFRYGLGAAFAKAGDAVGAASPDFEDSTWRIVDLPHDWAVELDVVNASDKDLEYHGFKPLGRRFPETSIGWYRRSFVVPQSEGRKDAVLLFDGVFRDCEVWLNGHYLGRNLSGYSEFAFDVSDYLLPGQKNSLVVRVDATQYEGWFYEGAGIYRHVWLETHASVYVPHHGVFVHSMVAEGTATVRVETEVRNAGSTVTDLSLETVIIDRTGNRVASDTQKQLRSAPSSLARTTRQLRVANPRVWSIEDPYRYTAVSILKQGALVVDSTATLFGIRTVTFDKDHGFSLNGWPVKIKGVCCHQDHAGVGSALPDRLQYFRISRLKEMGCNAYRTSHNPPTRELLDACDSLGMLVLDENRLMGSTPEWMGQFERLVLRDRNHPSVVLWSIGNEEWKIQDAETGKNLAVSLMRGLRELDPTRSVTYAANNGNRFDGINCVMPIRGFNYLNVSDIDRYRKEHPDQILLGSEEASTVCTRGIYVNDTVRGYVSDYDINKPRWGATAEQWWSFYSKREWLAGAFVWTGFDYRGEPTPYGWPCINSHFGIMDVCGFPKNNFFYYQAWWSDGALLHVAPHWNWRGREGQPIDVWCQSNCDSVDLFLNGSALGRKVMIPNSHLEWRVPYASGVLEARGYRKGRVLTTRVETTGEPVRLRLTPDRAGIMADGEDVCVVTVEALDDHGRPVPLAEPLAHFSVVGAARIIGVGNGDPGSHERDKFLAGGYQRRLFNGKAQVIIQAERRPGSILLRAAADGMASDTLAITSADASPRPSLDP